MSSDIPKICSTLDTITRPGISLVGTPKKYWNNGSTINIRFLNGNSFVQQKVIQYAREWEKYANIKFNFIDEGNSDVRIAFKWNGFPGSDSYVGTDATSIPQNEPTMRFGWFDNNTTDAEFKRVTLHEFGHMLGFEHEHKNPSFNVPWNEPEVYKYYRTFPNPPWNDEYIKTNVIDKANKTITNFTQFDRKSIMIYAIPNSQTIGDFEVGWNYELSDTDKSFMQKQYPTISVIKFASKRGIQPPFSVNNKLIPNLTNRIQTNSLRTLISKNWTSSDLE